MYNENTIDYIVVVDVFVVVVVVVVLDGKKTPDEPNNKQHTIA